MGCSQSSPKNAKEPVAAAAAENTSSTGSTADATGNTGKSSSSLTDAQKKERGSMYLSPREMPPEEDPEKLQSSGGPNQEAKSTAEKIEATTIATGGTGAAPSETTDVKLPDNDATGLAEDTGPAAAPEDTDEKGAPDQQEPQGWSLMTWMHGLAKDTSRPTPKTVQDIIPEWKDFGRELHDISGVSYEDWCARHKPEFDDIYAWFNDPKWQFNRELEGNVVVHTMPDDATGLTAFKARGRVNTTKKGATLNTQLLWIVVNLLTDPSKRKDWDETCIHGEVLLQHLPYYRCAYLQIASGKAFISNRDLLLESKVSFKDDGSLCFLVKSIDLPEKPESASAEQGFVRIDMKKAAYIIRPTETPGHFDIDFGGCVDIKGWVPGFVAGMIAWKQGSALVKFKQQYEL